MSRSFLFLIDKYKPFPSSNGASISNVVACLLTQGNQVVVLCLYDKYELFGDFGEHVHSLDIDKPVVSLKNKVLRYLDDSKLTKKLFSKAIQLNDQYKFDLVVSVFRPIETILCGYLLRKRFSIIHYPCFFDIPQTAQLERWKMVIISINYNRLYRKLIKYSKLIVLKYYADIFYYSLPKKMREQVLLVGVPSLLVKEKLISVNEEKQDQISIAYAGSFYEDIRNPKVVLDTLKFIIGSNIYLHLYSWGCESIIDEYKLIYGENLKVHGKLSLQEVKEALKISNILLNISNDSSYQVPGKIMEYYAIGKPVLNYRFRENDIGNCDYNRYPLIFNYDLFRSSQNYSVESFIRDNSTKVIDCDIKAIFKESTPEYFCELLATN